VCSSDLWAIREAPSETRVIVTSRYDFDFPPEVRLHRESLGHLRGTELAKKLAFLAAFQEGGPADPDLRAQALDLAGGNPRLLERLDKVLLRPDLDQAAILQAMAAKVEEFREEVLLRALLAQQGPELRRCLALLAVLRLPADPDLTAATLGPGPDMTPHLAQAVAVGLLEAPLAPADGRPRSYVSDLVRPLVAAELTDPERQAAAGRAAGQIHEFWKAGGGLTEAELVHLVELAILAEEQEVAVEAANWVASVWNYQARWTETVVLCRAVLTLGPSPFILHQLARAHEALGQAGEAEANYQAALALLGEPGGDEPEEVIKNRNAIRHNLALHLINQGDHEQALILLQMSRGDKGRIENDSDQASSLLAMAKIVGDQGRTRDALSLLGRALRLANRIQDLPLRAGCLHNLACYLTELKKFSKALWLFRLALSISEKFNDRQAQATTLNQLARIYIELNDLNQAQRYLSLSLKMAERIKNLRSQALALGNMATVAYRQGDQNKAYEINLRVASLLVQVRDWPNLITVLTCLSDHFQEKGLKYLAQAFWLTGWVAIAAEGFIQTSYKLITRLGPLHPDVPLVATTANYQVQIRFYNHSQEDKLREATSSYLEACAEARGVKPDDFPVWFHTEGLDDPAKFLPRLEAALERIVGDEWLFDRRLLPALDVQASPPPNFVPPSL
jgi:tetratricopeptide (TPR) repeat protein